MTEEHETLDERSGKRSGERSGKRSGERSGRVDVLRRRLDDRLEGRGVLVLLVIGVLALLLALLLAYVTFRDTVGSADAAAPPPVATERVVSRKGGFSVAAPTEMQVARKQGTVRLTSPDKDLVVTVGPGEKGVLRAAHRELLDTLRGSYRRLDLMASERTEVDGRPALSSAGMATNASKVRLRFVVVSVKARPANLAVVAFAARDADPATTLPLVNAVVNGLEVRERR